MFNVIEDFYHPSDFGLVVANFMNLHWKATYQSKVQLYGGNRFNAYPCHETDIFEKDDNSFSTYNILKNTFENKTNIKVLKLKTFLRKIKFKEIKKAACYKNNKPHKDDLEWDIAGLIYFNSGSLKDGTYIYNSEYDFDPSIIIGSKMNRCTYYDTQVWHSPGMEQEIEERWVQPFFIVHKKETLEKINEA
jgi:hypothetical protein